MRMNIGMGIGVSFIIQDLEEAYLSMILLVIRGIECENDNSWI